MGSGRACGENDQKWAQALAAAADNVFGDLIDQLNPAFETRPNAAVHSGQIVGHERANRGQRCR
jgi:hypothetical protein